MPLTMHHTIWEDDGQPALNPNDYMVLDERGKRVGRIYYAYAKGGGDVWYWLILALTIKNRWVKEEHSGQARTFEEARESIIAAWATCQPRGSGGAVT
jgi:hypothetical protein